MILKQICCRIRFTTLKSSNSITRRYSSKQHKFGLGVPSLNLNFLLNKSNINEIQNNILLRKSTGNIQLVHELIDKLQNEKDLVQSQKDALEYQLYDELMKLPNKTHPDVQSFGDDPVPVKFYNPEIQFKHKVYEFSEICKRLNIMRNDHLGNFTGHKSYYLTSDLAELEQALIQYAVKNIIQNNFKLITVPDILPANVIECCGMTTHGDRNQVYKLESTSEIDLCLSGTSEMALAGYFAGRTLKRNETPMKVAAVSRCFRAETSGLQEEKGIYRVHQFTKVEMFSVCHETQSSNILDEFKDIEINLFEKLGLHFKLLDMPPSELGAPAYRKYDIETWLPGRKMWGEISSCSNCTDYQARRLNIQIENDDKSIEYAHTVNGTACAIPRMLISIVESFQNADGTITIPEPLRPYMLKDKIERKKHLPDIKLVKTIQSSI